MFFIFFVASMPAQQKDKVVISAAPNKEIPESLIKVFMNYIGDGLTESGRYEVLSNRKDFAAVLGEEAEFQETGLVDDKELLEIGHAKGANYACYIDIQEFDDTYYISCKVTDLRTGKQPMSFTLQSDKRGLPNAAKQMATRIATGRNITSEQTVKTVIAPNCCYDAYNEKYVDCDISRVDEEALSYKDAVEFCKNKGDGWRLPDKDELLTIYQKRIIIVENNGARFSQKDYWSSSKRNNYECYVVNFGSGNQSYYSINIKNVFRCVRIN